MTRGQYGAKGYNSTSDSCSLVWVSSSSDCWCFWLGLLGSLRLKLQLKANWDVCLSAVALWRLTLGTRTRQSHRVEEEECWERSLGCDVLWRRGAPRSRQESDTGLRRYLCLGFLTLCHRVSHSHAQALTAQKLLVSSTQVWSSDMWNKLRVMC